MIFELECLLVEVRSVMFELECVLESLVKNKRVWESINLVGIVSILLENSFLLFLENSFPLEYCELLSSVNALVDSSLILVCLSED